MNKSTLIKRRVGSRRRRIVLKDLIRERLLDKGTLELTDT